MTSTTDAVPVQLSYAALPHLMSLQTGDEKHGPSATSTLDVIWVLFDGRDHDALRIALARRFSGAPNVVVAEVEDEA
jgi:hypothetical protein